MGLQPGARFGRYELVSRIGRGGMAETYRARLVGEAGVTRPVLIKKVLPEHANDQAFTTMFVSEARISATLSHGNIAQVYDFGRVGGEYFLAMEYVDGQPLHRIIKRALRSGLSCIPIPLAAFIGVEMCRGLHYAHTRKDESGQPLGIVHRDISPENVLVSYEGQVKIVDFGIAKARELRGFTTEPGVVKGKYLFFSPEQARGKEVDARTDVWATGVLLYQMLCGQLPVAGPQYAAVRQLVKGEFPRLQERNPRVPQELEDIVMRALKVDREQRHESCHELGDALAGFLYTAEPRFSGMSLSHFMQQLFREELTAEGRQVQIPRSFRENMERWQSIAEPGGPDAPPVASTPSAQSTQRPALQVSHTAKTLPDTPASRGLYVGLGLGAVLLGVALVLFFIFLGEPRLSTEENAPRPIAPVVRGSQPPTRESIPEAPRPVAPPAVEEPPERSQEERARAAYADALKLLAAKQYQQAVIAALLCIEFAPKDANCHKLAGDAYSKQGEQEKAAEKYRSFLELAPLHAQAAEVRRALESDSASARASDSNQALSSNTLEADIAQDAANKLIRSEQYSEAVALASKCVERDPRNAECHMILGISYAGLKQYAASVRAYRKFLKLAPDHRLAPKVKEAIKNYESSR